jgi:hypothetical protein
LGKGLFLVGELVVGGGGYVAAEVETLDDGAEVVFGVGVFRRLERRNHLRDKV